MEPSSVADICDGAAALNWDADGEREGEGKEAFEQTEKVGRWSPGSCSALA